MDNYGLSVRLLEMFQGTGFYLIRTQTIVPPINTHITFIEPH